MKLINLDALYSNGKVGDWCFFDNKESLYIGIRYPRKEEEIFGDEARGEIVSIPICEGEKLTNSWLWNGNKELPTITPSINVIGLWHGFLTDGKLITV